MKYGILKNNIYYLNKRDVFINHHNSIYMSRDDINEVKSYVTDITIKTDNILSVIGEFFEREVLISAENKSKLVPVFSLLTGEIKMINNENLIFINKMVDSSGMASHVLSEKLIIKGLFEFYERQMLILSYLSNNKSIVLNSNTFTNEYVLKYDKYLKVYVNNVSYFLLCKDKGVYVVLSLGFGKDTKCIGLGTDIDIYEAIIKSQQEMLQMFTNKNTNNGIQYGIIYEKNITDRYHNFFDSLSVEEFKDKYKYLFLKETVDVKDIIEENFELSEFLMYINRKYGMEPYVAFFESKRDITNLKIIKIFDFNWFENMNISSISDKKLKNIENITGFKLNIKSDYVPFP